MQGNPHWVFPHKIPQGLIPQSNDSSDRNVRNGENANYFYCINKTIPWKNPRVFPYWVSPLEKNLRVSHTWKFLYKAN
jgi:hypothetical protein